MPAVSPRGGSDHGALGVVLLLPSWQARLAARGRPVSSWRIAISAAALPLGARRPICDRPSARRGNGRPASPTLGAASLLASQGHDCFRVTLTMAVFGIGAGLPLVLLGRLSRRA